MKLEITGSIYPEAIAGKQYDLQCSLMGIDQDRVLMDHHDFQWTWTGPSNTIISESQNGITISITDFGRQSKLHFHRLNKSTHSGNYICQVRIGSTTTTINTRHHLQINCKTSGKVTVLLMIIIIIDPLIAVQIRNSGTPTVGQSYCLTCTVSGTSNLEPSVIDYQWLKKNDSETDIQVGMNSSTLCLDPLMASHAGVCYACCISVHSPYIDGRVNQTSRYTEILVMRK